LKKVQMLLRLAVTQAKLVMFRPGIRLAALDSRDSEAVEAFFNAEGDIDILVNSATGGSRASAHSWKWI